eukprot:scaffold125655_cov33-Tisochrysis_lutea.AAC.5
MIIADGSLQEEGDSAIDADDTRGDEAAMLEWQPDPLQVQDSSRQHLSQHLSSCFSRSDCAWLRMAHLQVVAKSSIAESSRRAATMPE